MGDSDGRIVVIKSRDSNIFPAIVFGCYVGAASSACVPDSIISIHATLLGFVAWFSLAIILACIQGFFIGLLQAVTEDLEAPLNEGLKVFLDSLVDWTRMPLSLAIMSLVAPDEISFHSILGLIIMALVQGIAVLINVYFFDSGEVDKPETK
jgi:MFS family permease